MKQYNQIKVKHPEALLLFRVGDFYETFGTDAIKASKILGIVLTKRANGSASHIELAGFPHHSLNTYLPKLVRAGQRVAICDQLEDPKLTKSIVKRGVTELVTPGVTTSDQVLESKKNNFLCALHFNKGTIGISFCDISTGEFLCAEGDVNYANKLLKSFAPSEILYSKAKTKVYNESFSPSYYSFALGDWLFASEHAEVSLNDHFGTKSLKGFGVEKMKNAQIAASAILYYLGETRNDKLAHINLLSRIDKEEFLWMDQFTIRNLELYPHPDRPGSSLLEVIDSTMTPMGGRLLQRWIALPLKNLTEINNRLELVDQIFKDDKLSNYLQSKLEEIGDLERLGAKLSTTKISPKELKLLSASLKVANEMAAGIKDYKGAISSSFKTFPSSTDLSSKIDSTLVDEPANQLHKGEVIRGGHSKELDELREILANGKQKLMDIQQRETEATGIPSLKIAFNNVFGYYLEVRNTHKDKVPAEWIRKQTLVNAERYITSELKEYEEKIGGAETKIAEIELRLYNDLLLTLVEGLNKIQKTAQLIARIDVLYNFSFIAKRNSYCKPEVNDGFDLKIEGARHPVIEKRLKPGQEYISNNTFLSPKEEQILMITGPNMSGKSALLRQTALICLMAQMGSYVPADSAQIGFLDKVFVRVGASDNISEGESTFMVEMNETASILNNLSNRSLILLDEIGRGTSTYDGISIAWSIAEFLHEHPTAPKTLFATHYHELNDMCKQFSRIKNYNVSIKEIANKIIFMRKLVEGGSNHSFGIHVAQMAGMPSLVVNKANKILADLEAKRGDDSPKGLKDDNMQLSFFQLDDPILTEIKDDISQLDINTLTPVEALMKLNEIKKKFGV